MLTINNRFLLRVTCTQDECFHAGAWRETPSHVSTSVHYSFDEAAKVAATWNDGTGHFSTVIYDPKGVPVISATA